MNAFGGRIIRQSILQSAQALSMLIPLIPLIAPNATSPLIALTPSLAASLTSLPPEPTN
jgi:hypothetical protein